MWWEGIEREREKGWLEGGTHHNITTKKTCHIGKKIINKCTGINLKKNNTEREPFPGKRTLALISNCLDKKRNVGDFSTKSFEVRGGQC